MVLETITSFEFKDFVFRDTWKSIAIAVAIGISLYLSLTWILTNVTGQIEIVSVYIMLFALGVVAWASNLIKKHVTKLEALPIGMISIGYSAKAIAIFSLLSLPLIYWLVTQQLTVALPLDVTYKQIALGMDYIYKVIMSPILEEIFRSAILITTGLIVWRFTKNWVAGLAAGLIFSSIIFGVFHWLAYQQSFDFIGAAIIFGLIAGLLMIMSKSIIPAIVFHWANNQMIYSEGDATALIIAGALISAFLIVAVKQRWS